MKIWKILFVLLLLLFILNVMGLSFQNRQSVEDTIETLINGFSLIPVYGYAYQVAIGSKGIAIVIFSINFLAILFVSYLAVVFMLNNLSISSFASTVVSFLVFAVIIYPMYKYAFHSNELWSKNA